MLLKFDKYYLLCFNIAQIQGVGFMKKFIIVLFYTFIFLFSDFTGVKPDTYAKVDNKNKEAIVEKKKESDIVKVENNIVEVKQELVENEQEEIETGSSDDVQTTEPEYEYSDNQVTETYGTYGRLYVYGFSVALYDYNVNTASNYSLQTIVDNWDSAAYYINRGSLVIADHDYQGFNVLYSIPEGSTSYIQFADGSSIGYRLVRKSKGYNTGPDLVDAEGNSFFDMGADIIMYTCYDGGIMVTLWNYS